MSRSGLVTILTQPKIKNKPLVSVESALVSVESEPSTCTPKPPPEEYYESEEGEGEEQYYDRTIFENSESEDEIEKPLVITKTNTNHPKLCHDGFYYTLERINEKKGTKVWKCERTGKIK